MKKIPKEDIKQYWKDGDYRKIQGYNMDDFCHMWAEEEGITLPHDFSVTARNSQFFEKINGEKHATNLILKRFGYPIIETESLTMDMECAIKRATQLYRENGNGVIRANKMAGGGGTFIIRKEKSIRMMISKLLHHPRGPIMPLYSPFYEAPIEYGVFLLNGKVSCVIAKHLNEETGLHNLTLGAKATLVTDDEIIGNLAKVCEGLSELFGIAFGRIDVMETYEGLKIVELSIPNFKKFSLQDEGTMARAKALFLDYYNEYERK